MRFILVRVSLRSCRRTASFEVLEELGETCVWIACFSRSGAIGSAQFPSTAARVRSCSGSSVMCGWNQTKSTCRPRAPSREAIDPAEMRDHSACVTRATPRPSLGDSRPAAASKSIRQRCGTIGPASLERRGDPSLRRSAAGSGGIATSTDASDRLREGPATRARCRAFPFAA